MKIASLTLTQNRETHLRRQLRGIADCEPRPDVIVVAVMGGRDPRPATAGLNLPPLEWVDVGTSSGALPLSAARNAAAAAACHADTDSLVFLDVDCVPHPGLFAAFRDALAGRDAVWSGTVGYLPPRDATADWSAPALEAAATDHPARPRLAKTQELSDPDLFWSLCFAASAGSYARIGGFDEDFTGYGGEDTDFAHRAVAEGLSHWVAPAARAWHQHHESQQPPVHHLADIVRNAQVFHDRWGRWPMLGWLEAFEQMGLIRIGEDHIDQLSERSRSPTPYRMPMEVARGGDRQQC